jgi:uncharacterized surface protein with fasciclin (FAS1) repeats
MTRISIQGPVKVGRDSKSGRDAHFRVGFLKVLPVFAARIIMVGFALMLTAGGAGAQSATSGQDAWSALESDPQFSDAVELFKYAGLVQYVQTGRFTAFIPTDQAFDDHPGVLAGLLRERTRAFPDTTVAVTFVRSHAVHDLHTLSEVSGKTTTLTSIAGNPIHIDGTSPGKYTVTWVSVQSEIATAHIVDKPIVTSNALIYPVDTVVLMTP